MKFGYDTSIFVDPPPQDLDCPICLFTVKDPKLCHCGNFFCDSCIQSTLVSNKNKCPMCFKTLLASQLTPCLFVKNKVNQLTTICLSAEDAISGTSCTWTGPLSNRDSHYSNACLFRCDLECPLWKSGFCSAECPHKFSRSKLKEHLYNMSELTVMHLKRQQLQSESLKCRLNELSATAVQLRNAENRNEQLSQELSEVRAQLQKAEQKVEHLINKQSAQHTLHDSKCEYKLKIGARVAHTLNEHTFVGTIRTVDLARGLCAIDFDDGGVNLAVSVEDLQVLSEQTQSASLATQSAQLSAQHQILQYSSVNIPDNNNREADTPQQVTRDAELLPALRTPRFKVGDRVEINTTLWWLGRRQRGVIEHSYHDIKRKVKYDVGLDYGSVKRNVSERAIIPI